MPHPRSSPALIAVCVLLSLTGCNSAPPQAVPRQEPGLIDTPAVVQAEDESPYQILARRAGEDPIDEDEKGEWVIFYAVGRGATQAAARADAETQARGLASRTRKAKIETLVTSVDTLVAGPGGVQETSDFSSSVTAKSDDTFAETDLRAAPCSVQRSDGGFDAAAELAVRAEQVYPARTLEQLSQAGTGPQMDFARRSRGRGDVLTEFAAYELALRHAENTDVIEIVAERLMELGDSGEAADLYAKWQVRFPEWIDVQASSTGKRAVERHLERGQYGQALHEVGIWARFDSAWAEKTEAEIRKRLDSPEKLIDELIGLVRLTEFDSDTERYYHPDDDRISAQLEWPVVTVTRKQVVAFNFPEGLNVGAMRIDKGMVKITAEDCRGPVSGGGQIPGFEYKYEGDHQLEYREGYVDYILFFEPEDGDALSLPPESGTPENELDTSALDGESPVALRLREGLREFIEDLRAELKSGRIKALHLKWRHK